MQIIYNNISDVLNKTLWDVRIDDNRNITIPPYYIKYPERAPLFNATPGEMSKGRYTISKIVEFCLDETDFVIVNRKDLVTIIKYIYAYLDEMKPYLINLPKTDNSVIYANKLRNALKVLEPLGEHHSKVEKKTYINPADSLAALLKRI